MKWESFQRSIAVGGKAEEAINQLYWSASPTITYPPQLQSKPYPPSSGHRHIDILPAA